MPITDYWVDLRPSRRFPVVTCTSLHPHRLTRRLLYNAIPMAMLRASGLVLVDGAGLARYEQPSTSYASSARAIIVSEAARLHRRASKRLSSRRATAAGGGGLPHTPLQAPTAELAGSGSSGARGPGSDSPLVWTKFVAETLLPTKQGKFRVRGYRHTVRLGKQGSCEP